MALATNLLQVGHNQSTPKPLPVQGSLPCHQLFAPIADAHMLPFAMPPQGQPSEWALLKRHPSEDCFGVQLCGGYPDAMARCAQVRNSKPLLLLLRQLAFAHSPEHVTPMPPSPLQ